MDMLTQEFGPVVSPRLRLYHYQPTDLRLNAEALQGEKRSVWQRLQAHRDLLEATRMLRDVYRVNLRRIQEEVDDVENRLKELNNLSMSLENQVMQYNRKVAQLETDVSNLTEKDLAAHASMEEAWRDTNAAAIENTHALGDFCDRLWSHGRMMGELDGVDPDSDDFADLQQMFKDAYWRGESWARNFIVLTREDKPDA
jgi:DNA repair exonuclease SbcCD ATPase subunit